MKRQHAPSFSPEEFLHCSMPGCECFASTAALFVRHMKKKHDITVDRIAVAARHLMRVVDPSRYHEPKCGNKPVVERLGRLK